MGLNGSVLLRHPSYLCEFSTSAVGEKNVAIIKPICSFFFNVLCPQLLYFLLSSELTHLCFDFPRLHSSLSSHPLPLLYVLLCLFSQPPVHILSLTNGHRAAEWNHTTVLYVKCGRGYIQRYTSASISVMQTNRWSLSIGSNLQIAGAPCGGASVANHCSELLWLPALLHSEGGDLSGGSKGERESGELSRRGKVDVMVRKNHTHVRSPIRHSLLHCNAMCVTVYFVFI